MEGSSKTVAGYLHKLCSALSNDPDGAYELAISYISSIGDKVKIPQDDHVIYNKVHSHLASISPTDAEKFSEYYQKIKNSLVLKQRTSVLTLLMSLSQSQMHPDCAVQLFPVPKLAITKTPTVSSGLSLHSSKSTMESGSSHNIRLTRTSNNSFRSSNMALALAGTESSSGSGERHSVREAILAVTGVKARMTGVPRPALTLYSRIAHLGFLHDRLKEFVDPNSGLMPQGLTGEGLIACIRDELTEYYRSVAVLQTQACEGDNGVGTLRRLAVWAQEPLHRLTWLANIAHAAHHKKGGELATCVHRFVHHGDERVAALARRLLTALTYPMLLMMTRWLIHGEIDDPFNEFFIESRSGVPIDRMWHDKYRVREWMVPSFLSRELATQILATGKSVVFMREACTDDAAPDAHAQHLQALLKPPTNGSTEVWWECLELGVAVQRAHRAASQRLMAALTADHHLLDHLTAHRRYLLLAQGDFVHHLITLMQSELSRPASSLYVHNLTCTLEAAIRATNAQFEQPHVLERLHVNLYPSCEGRESDDNGWDVFALQYRVDGPLGTLFPATCGARYRSLFTQLWRVKRIEYALHDAWRQHAILYKRIKRMPEVMGLVRRVSCLRSEAVRLCGALQETAEEGAAPAWTALLAASRQHAHLDHLLQLHHTALERQCIDAMIHDTTLELQTYLRNVLNETMALRDFEIVLNEGITEELERREDIEVLKRERVKRGEYAFTSAEEVVDKEKRQIFLQFLAARKADLNVWARTYRGHVTTLILKLALHSEVSLQTLAFRLDYSDFYKRGDAKLHEPLTYHHKRLSDFGVTLVKHKKSTAHLMAK